MGYFSWNTWLNHPPQSSRQEAVLDKFLWTFVPVRTAQKTVPTMLTPFQCGLSNKTANKGTRKSRIINLYMELTKSDWYLFTKGNVLHNLTTYITETQFTNRNDKLMKLRLLSSFRSVTPCILVSTYKCFDETYWLHLLHIPSTIQVTSLIVTLVPTSRSIII